MKRSVGGVVALLLLTEAIAVVAQGSRLIGQGVETYQSASIDARGNIVITTADQRTIVVPREGEQRSFSTPVISAAGTAVGAQAMFANCCTSYDIPRQLVIYADGRAHRFRGVFPIFKWHFADDGSQVAFGQEPVHSGCAVLYELRKIRSERLIASADIPTPCGQIQNPPAVQIPQWVKDLLADLK
ncbi:MAG: hypothetical protein Q7R30_15460 [Acidobacteriota bacterium]|nr:hypothetical protein [Acidobacteriota bacterium]